MSRPVDRGLHPGGHSSLGSMSPKIHRPRGLLGGLDAAVSLIAQANRDFSKEVDRPLVFDQRVPGSTFHPSKFA